MNDRNCHVRRRRLPGRSARALLWLAAALILGAASGCGGPSVEDVCEELENRACGVWSGYSECVSDGNTLRERVEERGGCDGAFDDYLSCIGDLDSCDWASCGAELRSVDTCVGGL